MPVSNDASETQKKKKLEASKIKKEKELIFYGALVNAWVNTRMEKDKSILTLSVGGIGVLITLLSIVNNLAYWQILIFGLGITAFLISVICMLFIFGKNSSLIEAQIKEEKEDKKTNTLLATLDKVVMFMFLTGVIMSICIALTIGVMKIGENKVGDEDKKIKLEESLESISKISPSDDQTKSLTDIGNLKPENNSEATSSSEESNKE